MMCIYFYFLGHSGESVAHRCAEHGGTLPLRHHNARYKNQCQCYEDQFQDRVSPFSSLCSRFKLPKPHIVGWWPFGLMEVHHYYYIHDNNQRTKSLLNGMLKATTLFKWMTIILIVSTMILSF